MLRQSWHPLFADGGQQRFALGYKLGQVGSTKIKKEKKNNPKSSLGLIPLHFLVQWLRCDPGMDCATASQGGTTETQQHPPMGTKIW